MQVRPRPKAPLNKKKKIWDVKDTTNFLKVIFIVLLAHFSFSFLLRLSKYATNRTLKCFPKKKKNDANVLNHQL